MAGAVGIVFGLCVLSFTLGAALMYVLVRRREDAAAPPASAAGDEPVRQTWVEKPAAVEPVDDDYDSRPIHRNPVVGLPQLEPALAAFAAPVAERDPVAEPEPVSEPELVGEPEPVDEAEVVAEAEPEPEPEPEPEIVGADGYDRDGDLEPPMGEVEAPESIVAASTDIPEVVEEAEEPEPEPQPELVDEAEVVVEAEPEPQPEPHPQPAVVVEAALPPPAQPQPVEHTTWVEREDFRQRYLRTFEEVRRKAGSN